MEIINDSLTVRVRNLLNQENEAYIKTGRKYTHAWGEKDNTLNCLGCKHYIGEQEAKKIIEIVNEKKKGKKGWIPPPEERILGICIWGDQAKILVPPRTEIKRCRYFGR